MPRIGIIAAMLVLAVTTSASASVFDFAVATNGPVSLIGNARIRGANSPSEANILSAWSGSSAAFYLNGNVSIQGDAFATDDGAYATMIGNPSIGGVNSSDPQIMDHFHFGVDDVEFTEVDPSVFEPFATTIVDDDTNTNGNKTFTNIRIAANTNPTFSGNITLKGVVFVEQPNRVTFTGNLNLTGLIVTQDAGDDNYDSSYIRFAGNTSIRGVEALPDEPPFETLRDMPGAFLLAPGFGAQFTGNFDTISGCMAADKFTFIGNAGGTIYGNIISYSDAPFSLTGNSSLTFDRDQMLGSTPPGFVPEPATMVVLLAGGFLCLIRRRR